MGSRNKLSPITCSSLITCIGFSIGCSMRGGYMWWEKQNEPMRSSVPCDSHQSQTLKHWKWLCLVPHIAKKSLQILSSELLLMSFFFQLLIILVQSSPHHWLCLTLVCDSVSESVFPYLTLVYDSVSICFPLSYLSL